MQMSLILLNLSVFPLLSHHELSDLFEQLLGDHIVIRNLVPGIVEDAVEGELPSLPDVDQAEDSSAYILGVVDHTGSTDVQAQNGEVDVTRSAENDVLGLVQFGGPTAIDASTARELVNRASE